jgi:hypothetical protein
MRNEADDRHYSPLNFTLQHPPYSPNHGGMGPRHILMLEISDLGRVVVAMNLLVWVPLDLD